MHTTASEGQFATLDNSHNSFVTTILYLHLHLHTYNVVSSWNWMELSGGYKCRSTFLSTTNKTIRLRQLAKAKAKSWLVGYI
jgi:hypothetical protein